MLIVGDLGFQSAFLLWFVVFPAIGFWIRRRWRAAAARREEVKRLLALASEEAARAEYEARIGYGYGYGYGNGNGIGGVNGEVGSGSGSEYSDSSRSVSRGGLNQCAVCLNPTNRRCARCKAVHYCSGTCQIIHWRQGHKSECYPPSQSFQNDEGPHGLQAAVKQKNDGDAAVKLESREKKHGKSGVDSPDNDPESNDPTDDKPSSGDKAFRNESDSGDGNRGELDISEKDPSYSPDNLESGFAAEILVQKESPEPELTTSVQPVDNHAVGDYIGYSDCTDSANSRAGVNSSNKVASSSQLNPYEAQKVAMTGVMISNCDGGTNGNVSESSSLPRFSFDLSQNRSSELCLQGLQGLFPYESFVKLYNWNEVQLQPCGLINCGNSCYANVVLQCLAFTPPLTAYFLQGLHSRACVKRGWCFTCELERIILKAKVGSSPLSPYGILSQLQRIGSHLASGREEDAHEFLRCAVDNMQSICLHEAGVNPTDAAGSKPSPYEEETNLIGLTFGGYLRSKIRCLRCRKKSQQDERIMDLSVEIDGDIETLEEALKRFTGTESLDGENRYHCERCNSYERAKKKLIVVEAPNVLSITLKRYRSGSFGKLNKSIRFPEILNFAPYMGEASDKSPIYRLYGVVVHLDNMNSTFSGHYVCYIRNVHRKWFAIDDSLVQPVELERVLGKDAYMLFYSRFSPRAPRSIRDNIIPRSVMARSKHSEEDHSKADARIISSRSRDWPSGTTVSDNCFQKGQRFYRTPPNSAEVDSSSDSSSIFSVSDEASSTSTDSTRETSGADELYDSIFRDNRSVWNQGWRSFPDSDTSSSSSTSSSPLHPRRSPLSNSKRHDSSQSETTGKIKDGDVSTPMEIDPPAVVPQENGGPFHPSEAGTKSSFLHNSSSIPARNLVYSTSSYRETDSEGLGWPNSLVDPKSSSVYLRRSLTKVD